MQVLISMEITSTNLRGWKTQVRKRETRLLCVSTCMADFKLTILQIS